MGIGVGKSGRPGGPVKMLSLTLSSSLASGLSEPLESRLPGALAISKCHRHRHRSHSFNSFNSFNSFLRAFLMLSARAASSVLHFFASPPRLCKSLKPYSYCRFHEHLPPMASSSPLTSKPLLHTHSMANSPPSPSASKLGLSSTGALEIDGFSIEGVSVGGQETCILLPAFKIAFDIGRCPKRAVAQDFLFISHAHMDHIGGICMYVATRGLFKMKPPTVIVPKCLKATVEKLFDVHRELDGSELKHHLIGLDIGEEFDMGKNLIVKAFKTYHVVPSQGYVVYSVKNKLKPEYLGLPGEKIKDLKMSGVQITDTIRVSEVAFTGDTTPDFILDDANIDALQAKLLIMETTFLDDAVTIEHARDYGHTHLFEVLKYADRLHNKSILFIHFSARYKHEEILKVIEELPPPLQGRVAALTEGF